MTPKSAADGIVQSGVVGRFLQAARSTIRTVLPMVIEAHQAPAVMGKGPSIVTFDASMIPNQPLKELVIATGAIERPLVFGDNDRPDSKGRRAGQEASDYLARRARSAGLNAVVLAPEHEGTDWCDVISQMNKGA